MNTRTFEDVFNEMNNRVFYPQPIPDKIKDGLLEAAVKAATATAIQAYSIIVVDEPQQRKRLHQICGYSANLESPLLVVFCVDFYRVKIVQENPESAFGLNCPNTFLLALCDAMAAAQGMATAAKGKGLAAYYSSTIINNVECIRKILSLPEWVFPVAMLRLGYQVFPGHQQEPLPGPVYSNRYVPLKKKQISAQKKYFQDLFGDDFFQLREDDRAATERAANLWRQLTYSGFFRNIGKRDKKTIPPGAKISLGETRQIIQLSHGISRKRKQYTIKVNFLYSLATFHLIKGQPERALDVFSRAILLIPQAAELYCCQGAIHQSLGNTERSLHYFGKAVSLEKGEPHFYLWLGRCQLFWGKEELALMSLNKALELKPTLTTAWLAKAEILERKKVWEGSLYCYQKTISLGHRDHKLYNNMALVYLRLGRLREAQKYCGKALALRPRDPIVLANIGLIYSKMGEFEKAIAHYTRALKMQPNNVSLLNNKGYCLLKMECYQEALAIYELTLELKPGLLSALENKASCLTLLGRTEEALLCYNEILRLKPSGATALNNKALCLVKMGKYKQALHCYFQALEKDPDNISFLSNTAACLIKMQRYGEALAHYERALSLYPGERALLSGKGVCLDYLGRFDEAVNCYNSAMGLA